MIDAAQHYKIIILVTCASILLVATVIMTWATQNAGVPFLVVSAIYFGRIYEYRYVCARICHRRGHADG